MMKWLVNKVFLADPGCAIVTIGRIRLPEWAAAALLLVVLTSPAIVSAQERLPPQDLWNLYLQARSLAPVMISAHSQFVASQQAIPEARAAFLPKVTFDVQDSRGTVHLDDEGYASYPTKGTTVSLRQSLLNVAGWEAFKQAKLIAEEGRARFSGAEQLFMLQVCESYFSLLDAQDDLSLAMSHIKMVEEQLQLAQHRYHAGDVTIVDEQEAEAELERAKSDELAAANAVDRQRAELRRRVARDVTEVVPLGDGVSLQHLKETDQQYWVSQAVEHSTDVQQRQLASFIAARELKRIRATFLPTISLTLSHGSGNLEYLDGQVPVNTYANQNSFHQGSASVAMLQISIPLFDGFSTVSKERETLALRDKAQSDLADARLEAEFQAKRIFLHLANSFAQQSTRASALAAARLALASNKVGYDVGVRVNADVLHAQDVVYSAQRDLKRTRYDIILDYVRLRANAGLLCEHDLQQVNALLTGAVVPSVSQ